eukprot:TRINITY_DN18857_c0_g1_i2.p1 TRINITY_DN18857_c0_g1~~TRINITY_DN18857_c0_g1_i2.p1  ORF type:complete len:246 (-),score=40.41 TRINITY_DN18857_c0_g1_i2:32-769(-)
MACSRNFAVFAPDVGKNAVVDAMKEMASTNFSCGSIFIRDGCQGFVYSSVNPDHCECCGCHRSFHADVTSSIVEPLHNITKQSVDDESSMSGDAHQKQRRTRLQTEALSGLTSPSSKEDNNSIVDHVETEVPAGLSQNQTSFLQPFLWSSSNNIQCLRCLKGFSHISHLKDHHANFPHQKSGLECYFCAHSFSTARKPAKEEVMSLLEHMAQAHHDQEAPFSCRNCGRSFSSKSSQTKHLKSSSC